MRDDGGREGSISGFGRVVSFLYWGRRREERGGEGAFRGGNVHGRESWEVVMSGILS